MGSERHGLRRGNCQLGASLRQAQGREDDPGETLDRPAAIRLVRAAARGYCLMMALADAGEPQRRLWLKSASRLLRFAHLLESDGIQYSTALAGALARLLRRDPG